MFMRFARGTFGSGEIRFAFERRTTNGVERVRLTRGWCIGIRQRGSEARA
jgi:hypothetical protein